MLACSQYLRCFFVVNQHFYMPIYGKFFGELVLSCYMCFQKEYGQRIWKMNALLETYIFYVDMYIIQNFLMKIIVLYLSLWCMKQNIMISRVRGLLKLVAVAFLGTLLEVIGLLYMKPFYFLVPILIWYLLISRESSFFIMVASSLPLVFLTGFIWAKEAIMLSFILGSFFIIPLFTQKEFAVPLTRALPSGSHHDPIL